MDGGAWWAAVHGVPRSQTQLNNFTFTFHFHALEKEMATHSSVLAWRIPGKREPGGLPSMGSHRVGHDWSDLAAAAAAETRDLVCCYFLIKPSNFGLTLTYITESNPFKWVNKLKSFQGQITNEQIIRELRWLEMGQIQSEHKDLNF